MGLSANEKTPNWAGSKLSRAWKGARRSPGRGMWPTRRAASDRTMVAARRASGCRTKPVAGCGLRGRGAGHVAGDLADLFVADPLLVVAHRDEALVDGVDLPA